MRNSKSVRYCTFLCGTVVSCVPHLRTDFVPCVLIIPHSIHLFQMLLGAVLGAKSSCYSRKVFFPSAHLSAQLWSYCEHKFLWAHTGANPCNISNNFYFPVSSCMPCPFQPAFATVSLLACIIAYYSPRCREEGPFLGNFQPYRHPCPPHHCDA